MQKNNVPIKMGLPGTYLKLTMAIIVGAILILGIYFFVLNNNTKNDQKQSLNPAASLCICPKCGTEFELI